MNDKSISLSQLITDIKITLQERYEMSIWVIAEISEMNLNRTGHCYLELIEKDTHSDKLIAKSRATIWATTFRKLQAYFETTTGETLRSGLKVLLRVSIEFHEVYGFSLNVFDIDPQYTLGDMARKRALIIQQLDDEGVLDMNKSLHLPIVPQRIAIISSKTAAGYTDFINQLTNNTANYSFKTKLFAAIMQGDKAGQSIIQAFDLIFNNIDNYDAVVLIRGGGSKSDLNCFDDYELAYFITQFPIPVITGIGHERDNSIADIVAHTELKTPTAVAEFLIDKISHFDSKLDEFSWQLSDSANQLFDKNEYLLEKSSHRLQSGAYELLQNSREYLIKANSTIINSTRSLQQNRLQEIDNIAKELKSVTKNTISNETRTCDINNQRLNKWLNNYFSRKERRLTFLSEKSELVNPQRILERGFAMVTHNGKVVKDSSKLKLGTTINVKLAKGDIKSKVTDIN